MDKLLADLGRRAATSPKDPRLNRDLFFEPWLEAQRLGIPQETAELVALRLLRFGLFHFWTRVSCPRADTEESTIIVETDSRAELEAALEVSCPNCGKFHDDDVDLWEYTDTLYALNLPDEVPALPAVPPRALEPPQEPLRIDADEDRDRARCAAILSQPPQPEDPPGRMLRASLESNSAPMAVPTPATVWVRAWTPMLVLLAVFPITLALAYLIAGPAVAGGGGLLFLAALYFCYRMTVQAALAPSIRQKAMLSGGLTLAMLCMTKGLLGIEVSGGIGVNRPPDFNLEWGEPQWSLVWMGAALFAFTLVVVWGYDFSLGWLGSAR